MALVLRLLCLLSLADLLYARDEAVVFVVDPIWDCVESYVANVPLLQEYKIIKVMTRPGKPGFCNSDHADISKTITYNSYTPNDPLAAEEICPQLQSLGVPIAAVIPTFDPAVYLADLLAACVGARGNPSEGPLAEARRDKWIMSEAVRKAGLRSVKEKLVTNWNDAREYLESLDPPLSDTNPVIFKILQGSSSEGVKKIYSLKQAQDAFSSDIGMGDKTGMLLIQEFLKGQEYVIDSASRDGVHKVVMVFNEDLRPGNGIFDLYYGFKTMDPRDEKTKAIIDYANNVLTATGLRNGAADMEVIWLEEEGTPCLLDLNARWTALMWHDGLKLVRALTGNDQITATINAYLDGDAFNKMPPVPSIQQHGAVIFTNAHHTGLLKDIPGLAVAKKLPSYFGSFKDGTRGAYVGKMITMNTVGNPPLTILLAARDEAVMDADYNRIISLEDSDKFYDIMPLTRHDTMPSAIRHGSRLTALRQGDNALPGHRLAAVAAVTMLAVSAVLALAAVSRRNVRDGTEYLIIE